MVDCTCLYDLLMLASSDTAIKCFCMASLNRSTERGVFKLSFIYMANCAQTGCCPFHLCAEHTFRVWNRIRQLGQISLMTDPVSTQTQLEEHCYTN